MNDKVSIRKSISDQARENYINEFLNNVRKRIPPEKRESTCTKEWVENIMQVLSYDPTRLEVLATPLFELLSVTIHGNNCEILDDSKLCEIYGTIRLSDDKDEEISLFHRTWSDPVMISFGDSLSLTYPDGDPARPLILPRFFIVKVDLRDKIRDVQIAKEEFYINFDKEIDYDKEHVRNVLGDYGFASIRYVTFQCAVIAFVNVTVLKKEGSPDLHANIYGSISASVKVRNGDISHILFYKPMNQPVRVNSSETPASLFKYALAVPAYSPLTIQSSLFDRDGDICRQFVTGDAIEIPASNHWMKTVYISGKNWEIEVTVSGGHAHHYYHLPKKVEEATCLVTEESKLEEHETKRPRLDFNQPRRFSSGMITEHREASPELSDEILGEIYSYPEETSSDEMITEFRPPSPEPPGQTLVEVFSIFLGCYSNYGLEDNEKLCLCGKIEVRDQLGDYVVFKKDDINPDFLCTDRQCVSLAEPPASYKGTGFGIYLDLKDAQGIVICKGDVYWNEYRETVGVNWYNKRLCSVIPSLFGYAAVHYSIFSNASEATVKVTFLSAGDPDTVYKVYGKIFAYYGDGAIYSTHYEKTYYTSMLFSKPEQDHGYLRHGKDVQLSKSVVAVPSDYSLIVESALFLAISGGAYVNEIHDLAVMAEFKDRTCTQCQTLYEGNYGISIEVTWNNSNGCALHRNFF